MLMHVGTFESHSGKFVVSDPCFDLESWGQGVLDEVATGKWNGYVEKIDVEEWGERCSVVYAIHESIPVHEEVSWEECEFVVGVDSGQAGIFDHFIYRNQESVVGETSFDPDDKWYSYCCDMTLSERGAGVINGGVVSSSGFGDGGYEAFIVRKTDKIAAVKIVFITEDDLVEEI